MPGQDGKQHVQMVGVTDRGTQGSLLLSDSPTSPGRIRSPAVQSSMTCVERLEQQTNKQTKTQTNKQETQP